MMPPEATATGHQAGHAEEPPAASVCLETLKNRPDFLRAARARRQPMPGFLLQARRRKPEEAAADSIRVGFTCSKKVGNAVTRNRAKRRLREVARAVLPACGHPGWDYVLIGRPGVTVGRPFADLAADLRQALQLIHRKEQ